MNNITKKYKPLREIFTRGLWQQSIVIFLLVILVFFFSQIQENHRLYDIEKNRLESVTYVVSRALAGELIINNMDGVNILMPMLVDRHNLNNLVFDNQPLVCKNINYLPLIKTQACLAQKVGGLKKDFYIAAYSDVPGQDFILNSYFLIIFIVSFVGFAFYQRIYSRLNKQVIQPIINLANNPDKDEIAGNDVAREVVHIKEVLKDYIKKRDESQSYQEKIRITKQVAHDIRSPLAALEIILKEAKDIPENKRILLRNAVVSIKSIVANLSKHDKESGKQEKQSSEMVFELLEYIVIEQQAKLADKDIAVNYYVEDDAYSLFVNIKPVEFIRAISNIINNAHEAIRHQGTIDVNLSKTLDQAIITIRDNGCGISEDMLDRIFDEGVTLGKKEGSGMGLTIVADYINQWHGTYKIKSEINIGTVFIVKLPLVRQPKWFLDSLYIRPKMTVVILDDDESIHSVWRERFCKYLDEKKIDLVHISHEFDIAKYQSGYKNLTDVIYLVDHELIGFSKNGLQIIEQFDIRDKAVLVTSHSASSDLRKECEQKNIKMIPKSYSVHIPIQMLEDAPQYVLLDDDFSITAAWEFAAKSKKISLETFNEAAKFYSYIVSCPKNIEIYIDYELGQGIKGDTVAKTLYEKGYHNIYIATGYDAEFIEKTPWVKAVVNKIAPF